jgi:hypothetical protein
VKRVSNHLDEDGELLIPAFVYKAKGNERREMVVSLVMDGQPVATARWVLSIAANDAHAMTWCGIQKLCINSGD